MLQGKKVERLSRMKTPLKIYQNENKNKNPEVY